jgi:O-Antigen ligase
MILQMTRWRPLMGWLAVSVTAVLLGALAPLLSTPLGLLGILLVPGALVLGFGFLLAGPVACIGAIAALAVLGGFALTVEFGPVGLQLADVFYAALLLWVIAGRSIEATGLVGQTRSAARIRTWGIVVFVVYIGLSVLKVALVDPAHLETSLVSWLRLAQTASLIGLTGIAIKTTLDVRRLLKILSVGCAAAVVIALVQAVQAGGQAILDDRFGGLLNPNSLGLVSGLAILLALSAPISRDWRSRLAFGSIGIIGLLLSKSVAATIGVVLVIGLGYGVQHRRSSVATDRLVRVVVLMGLGLLVALAMVRTLRPEVIPTSPLFRYSSATHRAVVAVAGWEIFVREPLTGVGWQRSSSPAVIGSGELAAALRAHFPGANPDFFPDVVPTSVHNAYVQVLAELGLIGFAIFTAAVTRAGMGIRRLVQGMGADNGLAPTTRFMTLGLMLILIWWNDNPIFGGQVETVLASVFLGTLVAIRGIHLTEVERRGASATYPSRVVA